MPEFALLGTANDIPVFAWRLKDPEHTAWSLYDLSNMLRMKGWQVPAYPLPSDLASVTVQRIVVRNGFSRDLAAYLVRDLRVAVRDLQAGFRSSHVTQTPQAGFHH